MIGNHAIKLISSSDDIRGVRFGCKENKLSLQSLGTAKVAGQPGVILVDPVVVTAVEKD
ncbi:hypothetical protein ACES2I_11335 [Bdellovibrio bacteriovorus]|uniref:hypothetical protein n=1 Tax=Bdellovibrio bacteriovorus TaxID=959 RepID=UPI0035A64514